MRMDEGFGFGFLDGKQFASASSASCAEPTQRLGRGDRVATKWDDADVMRRDARPEAEMGTRNAGLRRDEREEKREGPSEAAEDN